MAHRKRGRPKTSRAGCLLCKPHKNQRCAKTARSKRARVALSDRIGDMIEPPLHPREIALL